MQLSWNIRAAEAEDQESQPHWSFKGDFELNPQGDQILVFTGSLESPTFVFGAHYHRDSWDEDGASDDHTSARPDGLSDHSFVLLGNNESLAGANAVYDASLG